VAIDDSFSDRLPDRHNPETKTLLSFCGGHRPTESASFLELISALTEEHGCAGMTPSEVRASARNWTIYYVGLTDFARAAYKGIDDRLAFAFATFHYFLDKGIFAEAVKRTRECGEDSTYLLGFLFFFQEARSRSFHNSLSSRSGEFRDKVKDAIDQTRKAVQQLVEEGLLLECADGLFGPIEWSGEIDLRRDKRRQLKGEITVLVRAFAAGIPWQPQREGKRKRPRLVHPFLIELLRRLEIPLTIHEMAIGLHGGGTDITTSREDIINKEVAHIEQYIDPITDAILQQRVSLLSRQVSAEQLRACFSARQRWLPSVRDALKKAMSGLDWEARAELIRRVRVTTGEENADA
jgi:hypothetical protein